MSILIKGMEMPKSCLNCFLSRSGCRAVLKRMRAMEAGTWIPANYRHDDCPLVPVPPHGRLGDLDALFKQVTMDEHFSVLEAMYVQSLISNAPTIIPADSEKEATNV